MIVQSDNPALVLICCDVRDEQLGQLGAERRVRGGHQPAAGDRRGLGRLPPVPVLGGARAEDGCVAPDEGRVRVQAA